MALTDRPQPIPSALDTRRIATLVAGDLVAFNVVTSIGLLSHGELTGLDALGQVVIVAAPFAIGWFLIAPFAGAFRADIAGQPRRILPRSALAWLIALPIGLLLWSLMSFEHWCRLFLGGAALRPDGADGSQPPLIASRE